MGKVDTVIDGITKNWPQIDNERTRFSIAVQYIAAQLNACASEALKPHDLSFTSFEVLCALRASGPRALLPTDLYARVLISSGGLTKILKALEGRGLIERPPARGDARRKPVVLTAAGVDAVETAMAAVQEAEGRLLAGSDKDSRSMADLNRDLLRTSDLISEEQG